MLYFILFAYLCAHVYPYFLCNIMLYYIPLQKKKCILLHIRQRYVLLHSIIYMYVAVLDYYGILTQDNGLKQTPLVHELETVYYCVQ